MSQVPPILLQKLAALRRRERLLHLLWGVARAASVVLGILIVACLIDWTVDLWDDTPSGLRWFLLVAQIVVAALAVLVFVVLPQLRRLRNEKLALWVEDRWPTLQHRLISALQLNRQDSRTQGMSPALISAATEEAIEQATPIDFSSVADHRRVKRSAWVFAPVALVGLLLFLLSPSSAWALLQRQLMEDVEIPRTVNMVSGGQEIWPSGEEVQLAFVVQGVDSDTLQGRTGTVRVREAGDNGRAFTVPLKFGSTNMDGSATLVAKVPPSSVDFSYMAKFMDGRTRKPSKIEYVARPSVIEQKAYVILPDYVGLSPEEWTNGARTSFEQEQLRGDIVANAGGASKARVVIETQKPIKRAVLEIFGSPYPDLSAPRGLTRTHDLRAKVANNATAILMRPAGPLAALCSANSGSGAVPTREPLQQDFPNSTQHVEWQFDLRPTETSYRIVVFDEYGFASKTETVRAIKIEQEPSPSVVLHAERWEPKAEFKSKSKAPEIHDLEGMPLPIVDGVNPGPVRISYEAFGPYGIGKVQLKIGVIRGSSESEDPKNPKLERWVTLPLDEVPQPKNARVFDKSKGAFQDSADDEWRIPFYPMPSTAPAKQWSRVFGGGRYEYRPAGILDDDGKPFAFKPGDQVAVYVEVFNCNPDPAKALMAKSRLREKEVVPLNVFVTWLSDTLQEASRVEALVYLQQQVYDRPWFSIFGFGK